MVEGTDFVLQGDQHAGKVYVEDEDNFLSYVEQPSSAYLSSYYVEDEDNVGTYKKLGSQYSGTLYTLSNGLYTPVSTPLYYSGGTGTYPLYTKVSKTLYAKGSTKTQTLYKQYTKKLYDEGKAVTFNPATITTKEVTALTTSAEGETTE